MMKHQINFIPKEVSDIHGVDFNNIPFGKVFADYMFEADYDGHQWTNPTIKPLAELSIHPGNLAWHYGQAIFEGMKATKHIDGTPLLFRPELHARRFNISAQRMCMPEVEESLFLDAVHALVDLEKDWIPTEEGSALYIRPLMVATDEFLGVRASEKYKLLMFTLPVGPYYTKPVSLKAETKYVRAAEGGVGFAKTAGNYGASLYPAKLAKEAGYDQVMWMDAKEFRYVQEVGTMNIFFVLDNKIVTPAISGTILDGITRLSIIEILRSQGHTVEEKPVDILKVVEAYKNGRIKEIFGTGTAAVIANVHKVAYKDTIMTFDVDSYTISPKTRDYINNLRSGKIEDTRGWVERVRSTKGQVEV